MPSFTMPSFPTSQIEAVQGWIQDQVLDTVDQQITRRNEHWSDPNNARPTPEDVPDLIRDIARKNAALAGGCTVVPGLAAAVTIPGELYATIRNHVTLVYDIAVAYGQEDVVDAELVLALAFSDAKSTPWGIRFATQDDATVVRPPTGKLITKFGALAARTLAKRLLRLVFGRLVPLFGAVGAAWWARSNTFVVGRRATDVFRRKVNVDRGSDEGALERELDAALATPVEMRLSPPLARVQHALFANALRHGGGYPEQVERFASLSKSWAHVPELADAQAVLARDRDFEINLPALGELPIDELLGQLVDFDERLADDQPQWFTDVIHSLGLNQDEVEELLAA